MHTIIYTLTRGEDDIDLEVEYTVAPFDPGCISGPPEYCEPPSGGEVEELDAFLDMVPFPLTDAEREDIERYIYDNHDYQAEAYGYAL